MDGYVNLLEVFDQPAILEKCCFFHAPRINEALQFLHPFPLFDGRENIGKPKAPGERRVKAITITDKRVY